MKLSAWTEEKILNLIRATWLVPTDVCSVGIGDDAAVLPPAKRGVRQVVTTDAQVEGVHFLRDQILPRNLGYKSLASNLSDIAAMGAKPTVAFLSWSLPSDLDVDWLKGWLQGAADLAQLFSVQLLGGNTTRSPGPIWLSWTVMGEAPLEHLKLRSGARVGDRVVVTGSLGDSWAGLQRVLYPGENKQGSPSDWETLVTRHFRPRPHVEEGIFLSQQAGVGGMMDISDGLGVDLLRMCQSSGVSAKINLDKIPTSAALRRMSKLYHWDPARLAVQSGEEYVLLLTVRPEEIEDLSKKFKRKFQRELYRVGEIVRGEPKIRFELHDKEVMIFEMGFDHFEQRNRKKS